MALAKPTITKTRNMVLAMISDDLEIRGRSSFGKSAAAILSITSLAVKIIANTRSATSMISARTEIVAPVRIVIWVDATP